MSKEISIKKAVKALEDKGFVVHIFDRRGREKDHVVEISPAEITLDDVVRATRQYGFKVMFDLVPVYQQPQFEVWL